MVKGPEIQEALHGLPLHQRLVSSLHGCRYAEFFEALAAVEQSMKRTRVVAIHTRFYVRELRIKAYQQLLQSYQRCVTVVVMQVVVVLTYTGRQTQTGRYPGTERDTDRQTQTDRHRQTDRQTDTDAHTHTHTQRLTYRHLHTFSRPFLLFGWQRDA